MIPHKLKGSECSKLFCIAKAHGGSGGSVGINRSFAVKLRLLEGRVKI